MVSSQSVNDIPLMNSFAAEVHKKHSKWRQGRLQASKHTPNAVKKFTEEENAHGYTHCVSVRMSESKNNLYVLKKTPKGTFNIWGLLNRSYFKFVSYVHSIVGLHI